MKIVHGDEQENDQHSGLIVDQPTQKGLGSNSRSEVSSWTQTPHITKPRDDQFYLRSAIFEVEDVLFQLPIANFVRESEVFKTLFEVPQPRLSTTTRVEGEGPNGDEDGDDVEGATDANPIRLAGVKKDDFKNLVRIMYARYVITIVSEE